MKNKYKLNNMKRGYFKLPDKLYNYNLSATAIAIYSYLAKGAEEFNPAVSVIARVLQLSKTTTIKYMKELKDRNVIRVLEPGGERKITKYEFTNLDEWK